MKTRRPSITVIAFTTKDLIGFLSNEDEDGALSGVSTGEYDPLLCLDLFCSGDTLGEGTTVPLSGRVTGKGVREILPEGWRLTNVAL